MIAGFGIGRLRLSICGLVAVLCAAPTFAAPAGDPIAIGDPAGNPGPVQVVMDSQHDLSPPLRDLLALPSGLSSQAECAPAGRSHGVNEPSSEPLAWATPEGESDDALQGWLEAAPSSMPAPLLQFDGLSAVNSCFCIVADVSGEIGPHHYVQVTTNTFQVFDPTGASLLGPMSFNALWGGFGGACETELGIQPIVLYDQLADRWLLARMTDNTAPYFECIAISQTADPTGNWYRYAFATSADKLPDLAKLGVWPDGYYMSANLFQFPSFSSAGTGFYAFERSRMLGGLSAQMQLFVLPPPDWGGAVPSDLDGRRLPPAGAPNVFVEILDGTWDPEDWPNDELHFHQFHVDWVTPANSTFNAVPVQLPVAAFDGDLCSIFGPCVPQLGTGQKLDTLSTRAMFRLAYRNFGDHESLVLNHTVDAATDRAAFRWYEIRNPRGNPPTIFQQSTFAPDTLHRWMGSMAMDGQGNAAIGYNGSSASQTPDIRATGRLASDPPNSLPQGETVFIASPAPRTNSSLWGAYSDLTVDPANDCVFWFTAEYTDAGLAWKTRIGAFRFPSCNTLFVDGFEVGSTGIWSALAP